MFWVFPYLNTLQCFSIDGVAHLYLVCALIGTGLFFISAVSRMLFGSPDAELGLHDGMIHDTPDVLHAGTNFSDPFFSLFSITALTGFLMMFGWIGLACQVQYECAAFVSFLCALAAGLLTVMVYRSVLRAGMSLLHKGGSEILTQDCVGKRVRVYQTIKGRSGGSVQMFVGGMMREVRAQSADHAPIASGTWVIIIAIDSSHIITVSRK